MDEVKAPVPPDAWQCVWVSYDDEGFFSAPRTEAELRVYFEIAPGLVEQRQEGTTFFSWDGRKPRGRSRLDVIFGGDAL